ncbi:MAG: glycoside hydrolase family 26 protein [Gaiellaceae bacterium]
MQLTTRLPIVVALALVALLFGSGASAKRATPPTPSSQRFLWGAWIGSQFTGGEPPWSWSAVTDFEARNAGGKHLSVVHWGVGLPGAQSFSYWLPPLNRVRQAGALSLVDMDTGSTALRGVANGAYDTALRAWATGAKAWGHPLLLRFDWEMNGNWFPWGTAPSNQNTPSDFVAAWRHAHDVFAAVGAANVNWVWCPNIDPHRMFTNLDSLYPGSAYVDWTCLDGYNNDDPWTNFSGLYTSSYHQLRRLAPTKPIIIGEVASTGQGGNKAHWISSMFHALATRFAHIQGVVWYDKWGSSSREDWPIETSRAASAAFRKGIRSLLTRRCRRARMRRRCA